MTGERVPRPASLTGTPSARRWSTSFAKPRRRGRCGRSATALRGRCRSRSRFGACRIRPVCMTSRRRISMWVPDSTLGHAACVCIIVQPFHVSSNGPEHNGVDPVVSW